MRFWRSIFVLVVVLLAVGCVSRERHQEQVRLREELQQALKAQRAELGARLAERQRRVSELERAVEVREEQLRALANQLRVAESRLQSALRRVSELDAARSDGQARIEALQAELSELRGSQAQPDSE